MAVSPILIAKGIVVAAKNWKGVLAALFAGALLIVFFPVITLTIFLPSTTDNLDREYKSAVKGTDFDWVELVVYDTVRNDNNFESVEPYKTAFEFLQLNYAVKEKVETTNYVTREVDGTVEYQVTFTGGNVAWLSSGDMSQLPPGSYSLSKQTEVSYKVVESGSVKGYDDIVSVVTRLGFKDWLPPIKASDVISFVKKLDNNDLYDAEIVFYTLLDKTYEFDSDHAEWAFELYTALLDENGYFDSGYSGEFYNTDPSFMASIVLDPDAYRLGDTSRLQGDNDINEIFAGRIAALAEDRNEDVYITSGFRSVQEQQKIWDETPVERRGKYVAAPGRSRHQYGLAADIKGFILYLSNKDLEPYGIYKPMSYERWHIEPIETRYRNN